MSISKKESLRKNPLLIAAVLGLVIFLAGSIKIEGFLSIFALRSMLVLSAFLGIISIGQTIAIVLGGIDLSIPYIIGFGNVVAAKLYGDGFPFWLTMIVVLIVAALIGAFNGSISSGLKIHPLILTLGVGFCVKGAILLWTKGFPTGSAPRTITTFVSIGSTLGPIPMPGIVLFWAVLSAAVILLLRNTVYGRQLYALGANPKAAEFALINRVKIWTITYALSAVFAALAGVLLIGFTGSALADVGESYMFQSIGAVVVGGTAMVGGRGTYGGTVIGSIVLIELTTVMRGMGLPDKLVPTMLGVIIIILVSLYGRELHTRNRI